MLYKKNWNQRVQNSLWISNQIGSLNAVSEKKILSKKNKYKPITSREFFRLYNNLTRKRNDLVEKKQIMINLKTFAIIGEKLASKFETLDLITITWENSSGFNTSFHKRMVIKETKSLTLFTKSSGKSDVKMNGISIKEKQSFCLLVVLIYFKFSFVEHIK